MPCYVSPPSVSYAESCRKMISDSLKFLPDEFIIKLTCDIGKHLSKEQLKSINGIDVWQGFWYHYTDHLLKDFSENFNKDPECASAAQKEARRLGLELKRGDGFFSMEDFKE